MLSGTVLIKKTRGSFDYRSDGKFYVAKWHDNSFNFFASYDLLEKLSGKMIQATGTMRNSRTRKITIMPVDEVKKEHRGFFDHVCNGTVYVCRWNDNAIVTLASNHLTHHPIGSVQRYSQSQKKHVKIRMPETVRRYNT
ncbi:PiggyBac transposable element-derived protein 3 [Trichinella murrelli]|uniref:PiggyBac transposable element-derived protein 3 n=1 Tax=Trichinella murrelli TaxID=144512 RepID=A0A0V0UA94_9BILA|nr:PiggyBac transposable element-derived protein 3 [Trichinella murrelli]